MKNITEYICERDWDKFQSHYYEDPIKSAVYDYVSGLTVGVNNDLRKGLARGSKDVKKYLDLAFNDKKYVTKERLDVYRVVEWDYMTNIYGITHNNLDDHIGKVITNKGYMSTSRKSVSVWGTMTESEMMFHITSKKPHPLIDINKVLPPEDIDCKDQEEILLPRETSRRIVSYRIKDDGTYLIEMEVE
jgi:hypothetical protein